MGDEGIGCDRCFVWFHPSQMCMGLSQNSIHVIVESEDSDALLYLCTACRLKPGSGAWTRSKQKRSNTADVEDDQNQLILQLFQTVKGLCSELTSLSQKIDSVLSVNQSPRSSDNQISNKTSYSEVLVGRQTQSQHQQKHWHTC